MCGGNYFCGVIIVAWIDWCLLHYKKVSLQFLFMMKKVFCALEFFFHGYFIPQKKGNKCLQFLRLYGVWGREFNTNHQQKHFLLTHQAALSCWQQTEWFGRESSFFSVFSYEIKSFGSYIVKHEFVEGEENLQSFSCLLCPTVELFDCISVIFEILFASSDCF